MNRILTVCASGILALAATTALAGDGYYSYTGPGGGAYRSGGAYAQEPTNSRAANPNANKNAYQQMMGSISGAKDEQLGHDPTRGYYESQQQNEQYNNRYSNHDHGRGGYYEEEQEDQYYGGNKTAYERMINKNNERNEAMREQELRAMEAENRGHGEGVDTSPYAQHRNVFRDTTNQRSDNPNYGRYGR